MEKSSQGIFGKMKEWTHTVLDTQIMKAKGLIENDAVKISHAEDIYKNQEGGYYRQKPSRVTYYLLNSMALRDSIVAAIINTRINQVASFSERQKDKYDTGWVIEPKDQDAEITPIQKDDIENLSLFVENCGFPGIAPEKDRLTFDQFLRRTVRDRLVYDQVAVEKVRSLDNRLNYFVPVDGATIQYALDKTVSGQSNKGVLRQFDPKSDIRKGDEEYRYVQLIDNTVRAVFTSDDLIFKMANITNDVKMKGYSISELELLIAMVTTHINAESYNKKVFTQGSVQKGMLHFKANISQRQLNMFKKSWYAQTSGQMNFWRTPIIAGMEDVKWIPLHQSNKDIEFQLWMEYCIKIICAIYLIDPSEINFDITQGRADSGGALFQSKNEYRLKDSRDRGLRPLLRFFEEIMNDLLAEVTDKYVFKFCGLDASNLKEDNERFKIEAETYKTINEIRQENSLEPIALSFKIGDKEIRPYDLPINPTISQFITNLIQNSQQPQGGIPGGQPGQLPPGGGESQPNPNDQGQNPEGDQGQLGGQEPDQNALNESPMTEYNPEQDFGKAFKIEYYAYNEEGRKVDLEKAKKAFPVGTIRTWAGQDYIKHSDGWVAVKGKHHGKLIGKFKEDAKDEHKKFADQHLQNEWDKKEKEILEGGVIEGGVAKKKDSPKEENKPEIKPIEETKEVDKKETDKGQDEKKPEGKPKAKRGRKPKAKVEDKKENDGKESAKETDKEGQDNPREEASKEFDKQEKDYAYARDSKFSNEGEDVMESARHKRNQWTTLEDAEKSGEVEKYVKRDTILKAEPINLSTTVEKEPMTALAVYLAVKKYPNAPKYREFLTKDEGATYSRKVTDDDFLYGVDTGSIRGPFYDYVSKDRLERLGLKVDDPKVKRITYGDYKKQVRETYVNTLALIKGYASHIDDSDPKEAMSKLISFISNKIKSIRETDYYSVLANDLVKMQKQISMKSYRPSSTSVAGQMVEVAKGIKTKFGEDVKEHAEDIRDLIKQIVIEGDSISDVFGKEGKKRLNVADFYVQEAKREGPETNLNTYEKQKDFLLEKAGLRGLQWGNSVTDSEREHHAQKVSEALKDLSDILQLPEKMISYNGRLALAIGARGHGSALAHYEPQLRVINLTRMKGVGSLAHEWGHFLDNILGEITTDGQTDAYLTESYRWDGEPQGKAGIKNKMKALREELDKFTRRFVEDPKVRELASYGLIDLNYWSSPKEVFARSFESYVKDKLKAKERENTYLSGSKGEIFWPTEEEMKNITNAFDAFFDELRDSDLIEKAFGLMNEVI